MKPTNGDGSVNWLSTHLANTIGDASLTPDWVFFVRMNNSTRAMPQVEFSAYFGDP